MLSERFLQLLTAYVDGELSARQRRHVQRLLRRSAEARRLLQKLQHDSDALIHLPPVRPGRDLAPAVLQKIAASRPLPFRRPAAPRVYPAWAVAAAAAAVLLTLGAASYAFFAATLGRPAAPAPMANVRANQPDGPSDPRRPDGGSHDVASTSPHDGGVKDGPAPPANPPRDDLANNHPSDPAAPAVLEKDEPVFTSEGMELFNELKSVTPSADVPATFKLHDLDDEAAQKKLVAELQKNPALRLELPVADGTRAFERLKPALLARHVDLRIDATAQRRLGNAKARTNYVLYSEDLTADDLAQLLRQIGADDKKAAEKKAPDGLFDRLVVRRLTERDHKELADLLGVDPAPVQPKDVGPLGLDPKKPVSDLTGPQVAATLAKPGAKGAGDHPMLALPYNPVRPRRDSADVKLFLDERKPLRPGALQVVLVLRGPTG